MSLFGIDFQIWLIAVGGALIHVLLKLSEVPENKNLFSGFTRKDWFVTITSMVSIPILILVINDTSLQEILPLNNVTSFLLGYQTQSFLRSFTMIAGNKYIKQ